MGMVAIDKRTKTKFDPSKPLANQRWEIFAQEVAKGTKTALAYVAAGYKNKSPDGTWAAASRLLRSVRLGARVAWLEQRAADQSVLTKEWLINQARVCYKEAREAGNYPAALQALRMLGLERATFIPKAEFGRPGDFTMMTDDELDAFIARTQGDPGLGAPREALPDGSGGARGKLN